MADSRDEALKAASMEMAVEVRRISVRHSLSAPEVLWLLHSLTGASVQSLLVAERAVIRGRKSGKAGDL
jgi:hypothetical protein